MESGRSYAGCRRAGVAAALARPVARSSAPRRRRSWSFTAGRDRAGSRRPTASPASPGRSPDARRAEVQEAVRALEHPAAEPRREVLGRDELAEAGHRDVLAGQPLLERRERL